MDNKISDTKTPAFDIANNLILPTFINISNNYIPVNVGKPLRKQE
jgi:hypothetical protein